MAGNEVRSAIRELVRVTAMWFGLGEPASEGDPNAPERRAAYVFMQTTAAVALGAVTALVYIGFKGGPVPADWPAPYLPLFVPLAIAVARRPAIGVWLLAAAVPAGGLVTVLVMT